MFSIAGRCPRRQSGRQDCAVVGQLSCQCQRGEGGEEIRTAQIDVLQALFRYRTVYKRFAENGQTMEEYSENASEAKERIRARAALSDIEKIGSQINSY